MKFSASFAEFDGKNAGSAWFTHAHAHAHTQININAYRFDYTAHHTPSSSPPPPAGHHLPHPLFLLQELFNLIQVVCLFVSLDASEPSMNSWLLLVCAMPVGVYAWEQRFFARRSVSQQLCSRSVGNHKNSLQNNYIFANWNLVFLRHVTQPFLTHFPRNFSCTSK